MLAALERMLELPLFLSWTVQMSRHLHVKWPKETDTSMNRYSLIFNKENSVSEGFK
jgi:hypothetical protein